MLPAVHTILVISHNQYQELGTVGMEKLSIRIFQLESSTFLVRSKLLLQVLYFFRELTMKLQIIYGQ